MDNRTIWETARWQSAVDAGCRPEDFLRTDNVVVPSRADPGARRYLTLPFDCHLISYGSNIVASVQPALSGLVRRYIDRYPAEHCFETPNLHVLNDGLQRHGLRVCFMAEYFLPDLSILRPLSCPYETRLLAGAHGAGGIDQLQVRDLRRGAGPVKEGKAMRFGFIGTGNMGGALARAADRKSVV